MTTLTAPNLSPPLIQPDAPAPSGRRTVMLRQLHKHIAHDRTQYDFNKIAGLTLQIYQRDLDDWMPIVAAPDNDNPDSYAIISGHRRYFARIFVHAVHEWAALPENQTAVAEGIHVDFTRSLIEEMVAQFDGVEQAAAQLLQLYGDNKVEIVLFSGSLKAQALALQAANFGNEEPDMLGRALSFQAAVNAGATVDEIARNGGINTHYVRNHLALANIDPQLAQRIGAEELPMSVARIVADLDNERGAGLTAFILANPSDKLTAKKIKVAARQLTKWSGLQIPLTGYNSQAQRNIARALAQLWQNSVAANSPTAWGAAAVLAYQEMLHGEPWTDPERTKLWLQLFGSEQYVKANGDIQWQTVLDTLLPTLSCTSCPVYNLPQQRLTSDIGEGQDGPLGIPCRLHTEGQHGVCLHGMSPNDPFSLRVPWEWAEHPGVVSHGGTYLVNRADDLLQAWQHQANLEAEEMKAAQEALSAARVENDVAPATAVASEATNGIEPTSNPLSLVSSETAVSTQPVHKEAKPKIGPIQKMRQQITQYIEEHTRFNSGHPFATPCGACRHKLDSSPTKDNSVPHCAWAKRLHSVAFQQLTDSADSSFRPVPVCRQYAPAQSWSERIPPAPQPPTMPRSWLLRQIENLVEHGNRQATHSNSSVRQQMFEFLTGRPMSSSKSHRDWFKTQFEQHRGNLSDAQLWTLFIWTLAELDRVRHKPFALPVDGKAIQFVEATETQFE